MYRLGPVLWQVFNQIAINYVPIHAMKVDTETLFKNIGTVFPCSHCRDHYNKYIYNLDFKQVLKTQDTFIGFVTDFHNHVNQRLHKPIIQYNEAKEIILKSPLVQYSVLVEIVPTNILQWILEYFKKYNIRLI